MHLSVRPPAGAIILTYDKTDRETQPRLYATFGVPHYWLIDPKTKQLEMFRLSGKRYRSLSPVKDTTHISLNSFFLKLVFNLADPRR